MLRVLLVLSLAVLAAAQSVPDPAQPAPAPRIRTPKDADQARDYYLRRRTGDAMAIPFDKLDAARARAARMRPYAVSGKLRSSTQDLGGWRQLGPANVGGRTKALLIHPADPNIMYAGAVTGGVWKTVDGGRNWRPVSDRLPSIGIGALAFDPTNPDTIYAGTGFWFNSLSASNVWGSAPRGSGIWRSNDAGESWQSLAAPSGDAFRFINQIIISRHDPTRLYAATWRGVFLSRDGGASWSTSLDRAGANGCQAMVARTDQPGDWLFASCGTSAANEPGIFRNRDAGDPGSRWERVHTATGMANTSLALAPSNQDVIYALSNSVDPANPAFTNNLLAVFRSTSGGDPGTWETRVSNADPTRANTALLSNNQSFFADVCFNGERSGGGQGWIHNAIAVDPLNPDIVFAGGIDIHRSDDGGANWGLISFWQLDRSPRGAHADVLGFAFPPGFDGGDNQTLFVTGDGGVYRTLNARAAVSTGPRAGCSPGTHEVRWQGLHGGFTTTQFYHGSSWPGGGTYFGGMQDNGTWRGSDGDEQDWNNVFGGDGGVSLVDPRDANIFYFSIQNFGFRRTENGGQTSVPAARGVETANSSVLFITPVILDPHDSTRLYTGGRRVFRTSDRGNLWTPVSAPIPAANGRVSALAVSPLDPERVIIGTEAGFVYRTNSASALTPESEWETAPRPRPGFISSIAFHPTNPDIVYLTYSQYKTVSTQSMIYRSVDGGATWQGLEGTGTGALPEVPFFHILPDPQDPARLFLASDIGVFVSLDGGATWLRDENPFANVVTERLEIRRDSGVTSLFAYTFGRGVWRTDLPGTGTPCTYDVAPIANQPALGGRQRVQINTGEGCAWSVLSNAAGTTVISPASGTGNGSVEINTTLNLSSGARPVILTVQGRVFRLQQNGGTSVGNNQTPAQPAAVNALPYLGVLDSGTLPAAAQDPVPPCFAEPVSRSAWWRFDAESDGRVSFTGYGRRFDVAGNAGIVMTLHALQPDGTPSPALACSASPRNTAGVAGVTITGPVTAGRSFLIRIAGITNDRNFIALGVSPLP